MEKLELKHLAPYLPYRLILKGNFGTVELTISNIEQSLMSNNRKPILRPLSDLSELGTDFATEHSINMIIGENDNYGKITLNHYKGSLSIEVESDDYSNTEFVDLEKIEKIRNELLKSHYDIFGLIEKGLAIDINTI